MIQKLATQIFTATSVFFGAMGVTLIVLFWTNGDSESDATMILVRLLMMSVFVILSSFAVSFAGKYLRK